jgi:hypothetical protein
MMQHPRTSLCNTARHAVTGLLLDMEQRLKSHTYEDLFSVVVERLDALTCGMRSNESVAKALEAQSSIVPKRNKSLALLLDGLREGLIRIQATHQLTYGEWMSILGNEITGYAKYCIRAERHPNDPSKPGDLA